MKKNDKSVAKSQLRRPNKRKQKQRLQANKGQAEQKLQAPPNAEIYANHDAGMDAKTHTNHDARIDAKIHANHDAGMDAKTHANHDAGINAKTDANRDGRFDAKIDEHQQQAKSEDARSRIDDAVAPSITLTEPVSHVIELEPRYRTRYGAWLCIILLWAISIIGVIWRGHATEWLLTTVLSLIVVMSGVVPRLAAIGLSYKRELSSTTINDEDLRISITLQRKLPLPAAWYVIYDKFQLGHSKANAPFALRASFAPLFHQQMSLAYRIRHLSRGSYEANHAVIFVGDWLGITCIRKELVIPDRFIVLPSIADSSADSFVANMTSSSWLKSQSPQRKASFSSVQDDAHHNRKANAEPSTLEQSALEHDWTTRPYIEGDHYRKVDFRSIAKGQAWQTFEEHDEITTPQRCHFIDQSKLLYDDSTRDLHFDALIEWCLEDTVKQGERQPVSVLTDNWNFDYWGKEHVGELQHLLAITHADVQLSMAERLPFYTMLLPVNGHIVVYSGAWKDAEGWRQLAEICWMKGSRLEIQFITANRVMTYAMREQQKTFEAAGIQVVWRYRIQDNTTELEIEKGSERYATGA